MRAKVINLSNKIHRGMVSTKCMLCQMVWFPHMDTLVEAALKACPTCGLITPNRNPEPLLLSELLQKIWEAVTVTGLDPSKEKKLSSLRNSLQIPISVCSPSCLPGFRKAAKEGKPVCCFVCIPCPQGEISNRSDSVECSQCPVGHWPSETQDQCLPKEIVFLSYEEPLGASLAIIGIVLSISCLAILGLFILYEDTPIIKANNRVLSYVLLVALIMCFLCSLPFIGFPSEGKCLLRQAAFGISFTLCVSCILAKTLIVLLAFNASKPNSDLRAWIRPQLSYMFVGGCTLIQVLLCATWLILSPPFLVYDTYPRTIQAECKNGSPVAFWCMLGYIGILATISFLVAFLARNLPDSFNEAKFITFSMLAFLSVWISFIPAYLSTKGKFVVAMEIFAILSSGSSLLFCIFLPKCYVIMFKPEMNTKGYLMR
ncbi:vomeronasal type-2 receptor 26-like [Ambystoma mexicanum]|uniref:vomeronasal type-2 receptor 26-like n=1 Tax=Ambystoma mexicanum TaxID=8296 RepID=UPI0037E7A473